MIGRIADAVNRMFAVEKVQDQHSGNQVHRDDKVNIVNFEKNVVAQSQKVTEVTDTYQGKKIKDEESHSDKEKKKKKDSKDKKNADDDSEDNIVHFDKKV